MPQFPNSSLPSDFTMYQDVSRRFAAEKDFAFFKNILTCGDCPEYGDFYTKISRGQGRALEPKTKIVYLPLIDNAPVDPSTMVKAQNISENVEQQYVVFIADQQLYRVALHVQWENQTQLRNIHLRLGGMHLLISYSSSVGTLMTGTGMQEILTTAFVVVLKMLTGKKYPQKVRAFMILVEELFILIFATHHPECMEYLQEALDAISTQSRISKL